MVKEAQSAHISGPCIAPRRDKSCFGSERESKGCEGMLMLNVVVVRKINPRDRCNRSSRSSEFSVGLGQSKIEDRKQKSELDEHEIWERRR